jgi:transcriptional regulator of acetoin/glycerol metabolism
MATAKPLLNSSTHDIFGITTSDVPVVYYPKRCDFSMNHHCPACSASVAYTDDDSIVTCLSCSWSGDADEAAVEPNLPIDVSARSGDVVIRYSSQNHEQHLHQPIHLSPSEARTVANAVTAAADDADCRDE